MKSYPWKILLLLLTCFHLASDVLGTVLIFENSESGRLALIPQEYGDRVTGAEQDGFRYGLEGGPTPHVLAEYTSWNGWPDSYGDLLNVAYPGTGSPEEIRLKSTDGNYEVLLHGFDLGGWPATDQTIDSLQILSGTGGELFSRSNLVVLGANKKHSAITFSPPLRGHSLTIRIVSGIAGQNIAIDNIHFAEDKARELFLNVQMIPGVQVFGNVGGEYRIEYSDGLSAASAWLPVANLKLTNSPQIH